MLQVTYCQHRYSLLIGKIYSSIQQATFKCIEIVTKCFNKFNFSSGLPPLLTCYAFSSTVCNSNVEAEFLCISEYLKTFAKERQSACYFCKIQTDVDVSKYFEKRRVYKQYIKLQVLNPLLDKTCNALQIFSKEFPIDFS